MKIRSVLNQNIENHGLCPGATTIDQWSNKTWLETHLGDRIVPIFPMWPIRDALSKHDIHHILTGYSTSIKGEAELAAWELASGGCHLNLIFWIDRISFLMIGLLTYPSATLRAIHRGFASKNLFARNLDIVLDSSVDEIRCSLNL